MTDKPDLINRANLVAKLARLCPDIPPHQIVADVNALGAIGARVRRHEESMCSDEHYYNRHATDDDKPDPIIARAEKRAAKIAEKYGAKIDAGGDCRGYAFSIHKPGLGGNTWGGDESGYGLN